MAARKPHGGDPITQSKWCRWILYAVRRVKPKQLCVA